MARIALLRTPKMLGYPFTNFLSFPLGLMYLASALRQSGGHTVTIIDPKLKYLSDEEILHKLSEFSPDYIGINGMTYEAEEIHRMAPMLKKAFPGTPVLIGGVHASVDPEALIENPDIDYVVIGEGERTLPRLIDEIERGNSCPDLDGLAFRGAVGKVVLRPLTDIISDLDTLPFPAWDLIDVDQYFPKVRQSVIYAQKRYMTIFSSRGCPYQCTYCHRVFGKQFRARSPENVFQEIKHLYEHYDIRELHIADDCFNLDIERAEAILDLICSNGLKLNISFPNGLRADRLTPGLLRKMKAAGTYMVSYAVETASPRLQKAIKKNAQLDKILEVVKETDRLGIIANGFFMMGFPGETREEMDMTIQYACRSRFHTASFFVVTPNPGTELHADVQNAILKKADNGGQFHYFHTYGISEVDDRTLQKLLKQANYRFYGNPRRMLRFLYLLPHKRCLPQLFMRFAKRSFLKGYED